MDRLIELFADELMVEPSSLNDTSSPDTVDEWDSLAAMRLVAAIELAFNVKLSTNEIMRMNTLGRVREVLRSKGVELTATS